MGNNTTSTAIRTDRALTAVHTGTGLLAACKPATSGIAGSNPRMSFVGVTAYGADQESHPPRGSSPA